MRLIFVLFFNILSYNHLFSQNIISGNIVDESNEPLIGINIFSSNNKAIGTVSDIEGNFELKIEYDFPFDLTISGIGYETKKITIDSDSDIINIILKESFLA